MKLVIFQPGKLEQVSATFVVAERPVKIRVWGMPGGSSVTFNTVEEVGDYAADGTRCFGLLGATDTAYTEVMLNAAGCSPTITPAYPQMYIMEPGMYRAVLSVGAIGLVYATVEEVLTEGFTASGMMLGCPGSSSGSVTPGLAVYDNAGNLLGNLI